MAEAKKEKKRRGDRKDAWLVRDVDSMHFIMPYNIPGRTANEAVLNETIDITPIEEYLAKKNYEGIEFKYTFFHVIAAAIAKTIVLRPKLNYFFSGHRLWEKKEVSISFVARKKFADDGGEALITVKFDRTGTIPIEHVHDKIDKFVNAVRKDGGSNNDIGDIMDTLQKLPKFIFKFIMWALKKMEYHGVYPQFLMDGDPYYSSCFITNLGSIKLHASYHHLAEWGTNSLFLVIGEKKPTVFAKADGTMEVHDGIDLGVTIDERIADGYYYAQSIKIIRHLLAHPELLELPIETPVEF
ncbi:MAG: hypothetical protein LUH23_01120 [Oscillospiraceae bacterium]|nr:hypothetical protein [Oscillospiraceae bacterium]